MRFSIYRFNPETDKKPYMQSYEIDKDELQQGMMLLDALKLLKTKDETLTFRSSCGEGVCGSDALNVNGSNKLSCITPIHELSEPIKIRPLPGQKVIRDLVVDMESFYRQYRAIKPWLQGSEPEPELERLQSPEDCEKMDGLYECILCGCCSTSCPSFWWNPEKFLGPAALLQAWRFVTDTRDVATKERLQALEGPFTLFRCHTIMNCADACPKELNPTRAIGLLKKEMLKETIDGGRK